MNDDLEYDTWHLGHGGVIRPSAMCLSKDCAKSTNFKAGQWSYRNLCRLLPVPRVQLLFGDLSSVRYTSVGQ